MTNFPVAVILLLCSTSIRISITAPVLANTADQIESRHIRTPDKISEALREKLEKLKRVLDEVDLVRNAEQTTPAVTTSASEDSDQKSDENSQSEDTKLSPQDIVLLKSLERALGQHEDQGQDSDQKEGQTDKSSARNMNDLKRTENGRFYIQDPGNSDRLPQDGIPAKRQNGDLDTETKDGSFGYFEDDVMKTVVSRLLNDLDIALSNGISVEEIIKYLYGAEQAAKEKQQRIQDEEQQLQSLLRRQNERD